MPTASTLWFNSSYSMKTKSATYGDTIQLYIRKASTSYKHKILADVCDGNIGKRVLGTNDDYTTGSGASTASKASYISDVTDWGTINVKKEEGSLSPYSTITFHLYTYDLNNVKIGEDTIVAEMVLPSSRPSITYATGVPKNSDQYFQNVTPMLLSMCVYTGSPTRTLPWVKLNVAGVTSSYPTSQMSHGVVVNEGNGFYNIVNLELDPVSEYAGTQTCRVTVENDRGVASNAWSKTYNVVAYITPKIAAYGISRYSYSSGSWTADDSGEYLRYYFTASVNNVGGNTGTYAIWYKRTTDAMYNDANKITLKSGTQSYNIDKSAPAILANPILSQDPSDYVKLSSDYAWTIRFLATDSLGGYTTYQEMTLAVGLTTLDFLAGGKGVAIGKVAERVTDSRALGYNGLFDVGFETRLRKNTQIDEDLHVVGYTTLDNVLPIDSGGTGSNSQSYNDGDLILYDEGLGGSLISASNTYVKDWLDLGNLAYKDSISASDVSGLGSLATKNSISLGNDVSGVLPVANGGTGSSSGLGDLAYKDAVTLSGADVTGTLPISKGGTGLSLSASGAGTGAIYHQSGYSTLSLDTLPMSCGGTGTSISTSGAGAVYHISGHTGLTTGILPIGVGGTGANDELDALNNLGIWFGIVSSTTITAKTSTSGTGYKSQTVYYGHTFNSAPYIWVMPVITNGGQVNLSCVITARYNSYFSFCAYNNGSQNENVAFYWVAIGQ